ncbi:hypothetical protein WN944_016963 [Citrus x changshan-huyou]|uniref:Uncharacterized protein n=1 Tax=Citrus x changshan-huyou TaxID=2935761 RepID=A0AAP0QSK6_9ROSI
MESEIFLLLSTNWVMLLAKLILLPSSFSNSVSRFRQQRSNYTLLRLVGHFNFEVPLSSILLRMQFAATDRLTTDLFGGPLAKGSWGFLSRINWARTGCWSAQVQQQN